MIIAIAGGSGSGKTTVSRQLQERYQLRFNIKVEVVSMDNYYKNIQKESFDNYDHPNAFNLDLLYGDLEKFLATGSIQKRSYDFQTKKSLALDNEADVKIVILEGLYPFYEKKLREICHLKLFLDVDENIRIKQRLMRDLQERDISLQSNMHMINSFVKEMYAKHVIKQKDMADKLYLSTKDLLSLIH